MNRLQLGKRKAVGTGGGEGMDSCSDDDWIEGSIPSTQPSTTERGDRAQKHSDIETLPRRHLPYNAPDLLIIVLGCTIQWSFYKQSR